MGELHNIVMSTEKGLITEELAKAKDVNPHTYIKVVALST